MTNGNEAPHETENNEPDCDSGEHYWILVGVEPLTPIGAQPIPVQFNLYRCIYCQQLRRSGVWCDKEVDYVYVPKLR